MISLDKLRCKDSLHEMKWWQTTDFYTDLFIISNLFPIQSQSGTDSFEHFFLVATWICNLQSTYYTT